MYSVWRMNSHSRFQKDCSIKYIAGRNARQIACRRIYNLNLQLNFTADLVNLDNMLQGTYESLKTSTSDMTKSTFQRKHGRARSKAGCKMRDKGISQLRRGESRVRVAVINVAADLSPRRQKRKRFFCCVSFSELAAKVYTNKI